MDTFNNFQPEEFLAILNNSNIANNGTGTMSVSVRINCLLTMLHQGDLREFDELSSHKNGTSSAHLNHITEGYNGIFLESTPPLL